MQPIVRKLGLCDYREIWQAMRDFTLARAADTQDEIWLLQHNPVFTQGLAGKPEHILFPGDIPVVKTDRGGQVTYHGPGQLVAYVLADLPRLKIGVREFVTRLERAVIALLGIYDIDAAAKAGAPGVYVTNNKGEPAKICSIGLKIKHGRSYHGIALNADMDLSPFTRINPCGYQKLAMTKISDFVKNVSWEELENNLYKSICLMLTCVR
jgi:lipoyl(octanoyl) transferase